MLSDTVEYGVCFASGLSLGFLAAFVINKRRTIPFYFKCLTQSALKKGGVKLVFVARTDLGMGRGKLASQCSHAAVSCYKLGISKCPEVLAAWEMLGQPKIVCRSDDDGDERMLFLAQQAKELGLISCVIRDAGRTQVERGSVTVVGIGPGDAELVNRVTGHLKLM